MTQSERPTQTPSTPSVKEVQKLLLDRYEEWVDLQEILDLYDCANPDKYVNLPELGVVTGISQRGGEGQGDEYWIVFKIDFPSGETKLYRVNGWYSSYDGHEFDGDLHEVRPVEKLVTFYE